MVVLVIYSVKAYEALSVVVTVGVSEVSGSALFVVPLGKGKVRQLLCPK